MKSTYMCFQKDFNEKIGVDKRLTAIVGVDMRINSKK
jgi:hypothetical protein